METTPSWSDWLKENEASMTTPEPIRMSPARKARITQAPEDRMSDEEKEKLEQQRIANNNRRREMRRKMMMMKKQKQQENDEIEIEVSGQPEKPQALAQRDLNVPEVSIVSSKKAEVSVVETGASVSSAVEVPSEKKQVSSRPKKAYESMTFDFGSDFNLDDLKLETFSTSEISYELVDTMKNKIEKQDSSPVQEKKTASTASSRIAERYNAFKNSEKKVEVSAPKVETPKTSPVQRVPAPSREEKKEAAPEPKPVVSKQPVVSAQPTVAVQPTVSTISRYSVEDVNAIKHQMVNNFSQMIDDYTPILVDFINQEQNTETMKDKIMSMEQQMAEMAVQIKTLTTQAENAMKEAMKYKKEVTLLRGDKKNLESQVENLTSELNEKEKENTQLGSFCDELLTRLESQ
eukprot:TRINITY_DN4172_c0_g1_i1.p1 TRINITY_DN4172_c0_g1~~TRINITY_DN4172_c0_g1_i1.p1  ORF type:complete len:423 (+),score=115.27 TRINITY_DN4172_c0_g1_i1:55-1269(+)